ncbi:Uma2 family endonuclease [Actinomadura rubrisoli]|uniref:Uma2 family endonuclease n=2 Tax=Actinomadura rubrisoli TaxID=2530368 RepID=A0A4R5ANN7_9ACTN|nr:Uma2 family endonuclease [Actinomadura rubrisoli]
MEVDPLPDWVIPPPGGFTADDFLRMRGLPRHTELIDGSLVFVSPQEQWHSSVMRLLEDELDEQAPEEFRAVREMAVKLAKRQAPEPDVMVIIAEAFKPKISSTHYLPKDVVLAVEVVSPESEDRDRETKPRKYEAAGIRHYWRVEHDEGRTVAYVYELDPATSKYALTGIHHETLKVTVPFDIEIDLTAVGQRRRRR